MSETPHNTGRFYPALGASYGGRPGVPREETTAPADNQKVHHHHGMVTLTTVEEVFGDQSWWPDQIEAGNQVREALVAAAKAILRVVPECPSRTRALNHLIDARMIANAAILQRGRV